MFGQIIIPPAVDREILALEKSGKNMNGYQNAKWIRVVAPQTTLQKHIPDADLDEGESEAIALAIELGADYLLMDERLGTNAARELGLQTVGLIGILVKAQKAGLVRAVIPIIEELESKAGFWVSPKFKATIRVAVGE